MHYLAVTLDTVTIWFCGWAAHGLAHGASGQVFFHPQYLMPMLVATIGMLVLGSGMYRSWRSDSLLKLLRTVSTVWLGTLLVLMTWQFFTKTSGDVSRLWFAAWGLFALLALLLQRVAVFNLLRFLRARGFNFRTLLMIGDSANTSPIKKTLGVSAWTGFKLLAQVAPADLADWLARNTDERIDEVWLCLPLCEFAAVQSALHDLRHHTANIRLIPNFQEMKLINHGISDVMGFAMLDISASPVTGSMYVLKAIEDYVLGTLILLLISVPMLVIAVTIKLTSPGPVLFKQYRDGWNGEKILVYKFRSMKVHQESDFVVTQATRNDNRVTPLGAFLRRTSLDELPQFINVLQGRMSIVGPRPHALEHNTYYKELVPGYMLRHKVKPGITGLAQINGFRGETDTLDKMATRVEYDKAYIESMSIWLDLKIIVLTIFKGFVNKNAY